MNCANARANFSAYVEHELSEQERRQTAAHLGRCPSCSRDLFAMQKAMSLIRWVPRTDARPGFEDRLYARLHSAPASAPGVAWWSRFTDFGAGLRQLWRESWVPAPAMAVAVAALIGTGSGAFITHTVLSKPQPADDGGAAGGPRCGDHRSSCRALDPCRARDRGSVATPEGAPEPRAGAIVTPSTTPLPAPDRAATDVASAATSRPSAANRASPARRPAGAEPVAVASATPARRPRHDRSARPTDRVDVAPWAANGGQPIEGPPTVSQVEYILNLVDVNQERVLQLPATAVVSGSTVTF